MVKMGEVDLDRLSDKRFWVDPVPLPLPLPQFPAGKPVEARRLPDAICRGQTRPPHVPLMDFEV